MSEQPKKKYKPSPSTKVRQKWLDLYYGPQHISVKSIADDYDYPVHTVHRVLRKQDPHRKERSDKGKEKKTPMIDVDFSALCEQGESYETQIELFIQEIMRALGEKKKIGIGNALLYANQLTNALRKLRMVQFGQMAKNLDVKIVERIIRRYESDASALRIIEVVKEVIAEAKADKNAA